MWWGRGLIGLMMALATPLAIDMHLPRAIEGTAISPRAAGLPSVLARSSTASMIGDGERVRHLFVNPWLWAAVRSGSIAGDGRPSAAVNASLPSADGFRGGGQVESAKMALASAVV
jgi:hypothetical protein